MNKNILTVKDDYLMMVHNSWTYNRMTTEEKENYALLMSLSRTDNLLKGNYKTRWDILDGLYTAYLAGLGYIGTSDWRKEEKEMNQKMDKDILEALQAFCRNEYSTELEYEDLKDLSRVQIMSTTYEKGCIAGLDEDLEINVFVDTKKYKIYKEMNNKKVYEETYDKNIYEFLEMLDSLCFDAWTDLDELEIYLYDDEQENTREDF